MNRSKQKTNKREWVWRFLFVAFIWLVVTRYAEIETLVTTAWRGSLAWLALALFLQFVYYSLYSNVFRLSMRMLGVVMPYRIFMPSTFASTFVNVVAPIGGASGVVVFIDQAVRHKQSPTRTAAGAMLALISDFSAFSILLTIGLIYLFLLNDLIMFEVIAAGLLLLLTLGMTSVLLLGLWQPLMLNRLINWLQKKVDKLFYRLKRPSPLALDWAAKTYEDFIGIGDAIKSNPNGLVRMLLFSFLAYSMDLLSLFIVFKAFHQPVSLGTLVAGFAMAILFWVITITPSGIGLVEGIMALVFTSLGIPGNVATVIALTFRGITFWLPFVLGFILLQVLPSFRGESRVEVRDWSVRIAALLTALLGVVNMISAVIPPNSGRVAVLEHFLTLQVHYSFNIITALTGFALLILTDGLWHRKETAWWLTLVFLLLSVVSNLLKDLAFEVALISAALGIWLLWLRSNFHAQTTYPPLQQGVRALLASLGFICLYGTAGFYLLDNHFSINFGLMDAVSQVVKMFINYKNPGFVTLTPFGSYFSSSIYLVTGLILIYVLVMLIRPLVMRPPALEKDRLHARQIIESFSQSTTSFYSLLPDKLYLFTPGGSVISYVVKGDIAITFGDPVGPPEDFKTAKRIFEAQCNEKGWSPVYYHIPENHLKDYQQSGLEALSIGWEHLIFLEELADDVELASRSNQYQKLVQKGYTAHYHEPSLDHLLVSNLQVISDEWLTQMNTIERRFSQGWFEPDFLAENPVIVVNDPEGKIVAFASLFITANKGEMGLDLIRYFNDVEEGVKEFLLFATLKWAKGQGYMRFNIGFNCNSSNEVMMRDEASQYLNNHLIHIFAQRNLAGYLDNLPVKNSMRYLAYPHGKLNQAALAIVRADSGDQFIEDYLKDLWRRIRLASRL